LILINNYNKQISNQSINQLINYLKSKTELSMVSNFSVATLFKINLLPQGGNADQSITKADLEKVKKVCQIEKAELEIDNI